MEDDRKIKYQQNPEKPGLARVQKGGEGHGPEDHDSIDGNF